MINAEFFIAASSVFLNTNWECCRGGQIEEYALFKRHTKRDFGLDWIVSFGKDGGSFSDSLCLSGLDMTHLPLISLFLCSIEIQWYTKRCLNVRYSIILF